MSKILTFFTFLFLFSLVNSCKLPFDDVDLNVKLNPEYAVPLIETDMNIKDLFDGFDGTAYLELQSDGSYKMSYKSRVLETLPFNLFAGLPSVQTIPITQQNMAIPFPTPSNTRIEAIDFKSGFFKWRFDAQATPVVVTISVPQFTKGGQPFSRNFTITNTEYRDSIDLSTWHCEPTLGNIVMSYQANKTTGESVSLNNKGAYELTRFESKSMKGYFGIFLVSLPRDTVSFDFFKSWKPNGKITFSEPTMTFNFENSYGFPVQVRSASAESINQAGVKVELQSALANGVNLAYPALTEVGATKTTTLRIDNKNSNITEILDSYPTQFTHSIIGLANLGNSTKASGFMTSDSRLKVSYNVDVPFVGAADKFVVMDTIPLDLSKFSEVTDAEFKITTDNGMPLDMSLQGYFISSTGAVIDSLVQKEPLILRGAPTTTLGTTIGTSLAYNFVKMDAAKFTSIRTAKKIIVKYTYSSTNNGVNPVKINSAQTFGLKLGVRVGVNL